MALAFVVGGLSLAAAVAGLAAGLLPRLDLLTHFTPFWFAGAVAAAVAALALARGGARIALLAIGLLGALAAWGRLAPELTRPIRPPIPAPTGPAVRLRLIQFNAWDDNADPDAAAVWISRQHADLVTAEEVTPALQAAMAAQGYDFAPGMVSTGVFSRGLSPRPRFIVPPQDWPVTPDFARARYAIGPGRDTFTVVAIHLNRPNLASHWPSREAFVRMLDDQHRERLIVAGDFNLTPWSFALARFDQRLRLERRDRAIPSWPALERVGGVLVGLPAFLAIDHVYIGPQWRTVSVRRGPRLGSDHYPLIVDLVLRP